LGFVNLSELKNYISSAFASMVAADTTSARLLNIAVLLQRAGAVLLRRSNGEGLLKRG
jgi:hypothetical protein